ncbi:MAG: signal peptidase I [Bacteroidales bacterium]|nr:signal peptidase I [Bacteroidales bacterium]
MVFFIGNFRTYMVMGNSDLPTFSEGDKVIINRSAYDLTFPFSSAKIFSCGNPDRGDMILCYLKKKNNGDFWLKRIIGLPGDTIRIRRNKVFINNQAMKYEVIVKENLSNSFKSELGDIVAFETGMGFNHLVTFTESRNIISDFGPVVVSDNHFFVLGDNRGNSLDSRFLGLVPRNNIFGKYLFTIYKNE